jgi:hypothetical protein
MLIVRRNIFLTGAVMAVTFFAVLILMFLPLLGGLNAFEAADRLFNSMAKGSSNYFEDLRREAGEHRGTDSQVDIELKEGNLAGEASAMLSRAGLTVDGEGAKLKVSGDLSRLAGAIVDDSEAMFYNKGEEIAAKYGYPAREALFVWWNILKEMQKALESKGRFEAAAFLHDVSAKGLEVAYNFYGIEPKEASKNAAILAGSLLFYVFYTLWWGYAILCLFDGVGMEMKAGSRKEV